MERLGFEQFTLEYSPISPLALFVSRQLFGNVYVSFYQQLQSNYTGLRNVSYEVRLGYRFKNIYTFSMGVDSLPETTVEFGYSNAFD